MNSSIEPHGITPVMDRVYAFDDVPSAFANLRRGFSVKLSSRPIKIAVL
jgi:hypothetical protein